MEECLDYILPDSLRGILNLDNFHVKNCIKSNKFRLGQWKCMVGWS